ncbi:MAG: hypothetical protein K2P81_14530 [Bacteriovoracaceae bacterium]|nr:hypothetical protein [Bacteriovoracaceae bacterium]
MKFTLFFVLWLPLFAIAQNSIQQELELSTLRYFVDHAHPQTGLVRDKANNFSSTSDKNKVASLAATGFGITVLANAAKRGLIESSLAEENILKTLRFVHDHVPRRRGWLLHFVDWSTGARIWESEYSPIDTSFFIAGALYAAQIFPHGQIESLAFDLYRDLDFSEYLTDAGTKPFKKTLSLSWTPERGFAPYQWNIYAEQQLLLLLGLGHPTRPLSLDAWKSYSRFHSPASIFSGIMGYDMPLFIHQYSAVYVDFRKFKDGYPNYFSNGIKATAIHRQLKGSQKTKTFKEGFWGLSAGEDPLGYKVYNPSSYGGTVCVGCAIASVMYDKNIIQDASMWKSGKFKNQIWGAYGFIDSLNLEKNWFSPLVLGITVGPAYLSLANMNDNDSVWIDFMNTEAMKRALQKIQEN